jgi:dihydrodipicolinate synthase/N-acetylneuraminate lyase
MGEGPYLSDAARNEFIELALQEAGDKVTLFACAGDTSRARMMERALRYAAMGAHCIVLYLAPKTPADKAIDDLLAVAEACPAPCAYYETPANTGTPLVVEELSRILSHENIHVCKDSSNNALISQALTSKSYRPTNCKLLHGNEYCATATHLAGYDGVLHGGAVLTGAWMREVRRLLDEGSYVEAQELDRQKALFTGQIYNRFSRPLQNTIGQKYALKLLGILDHETVIIPQTLDDASHERIRIAVDANRKWLG